MEDNTEVVVPETTEEVAPELDATEETAPEVDWQAEAEKAKELANNYKARAEKAEKAAKEKPAAKAEEVSRMDKLSSTDLVAVMKADIHEDDMERLERFAKAENMTIREALKDPEWKAIHDLRVEQRNTSGATNVSNARRAPAVVSEEVLLSRAAAGRFPDNDFDINRLIAAKAKQKR